MPPAVQYRAMQTLDLNGAMQVQTECHVPDNLENLTTMTQRLRASPDTAWVAEWNGEVCAYLVGYRSHMAHIPPLGSPFTSAQQPNCLYLHDLAVSPRARGLGVSQGLLDLAWSLAKQEALHHLALVSLNSSLAFWERHGFAIQSDLSPEQHSTLTSYADGPACYMSREVAQTHNRRSTARG